MVSKNVIHNILYRSTIRSVMNINIEWRHDIWSYLGKLINTDKQFALVSSLGTCRYLIFAENSLKYLCQLISIIFEWFILWESVAICRTPNLWLKLCSPSIWLVYVEQVFCLVKLLKHSVFCIEIPRSSLYVCLGTRSTNHCIHGRFSILSNFDWLFLIKDVHYLCLKSYITS